MQWFKGLLCSYVSFVGLNINIANNYNVTATEEASGKIIQIAPSDKPADGRLSKNIEELMEEKQPADAEDQSKAMADAKKRADAKQRAETFAKQEEAEQLKKEIDKRKKKILAKKKGKRKGKTTKQTREEIACPKKKG